MASLIMLFPFFSGVCNHYPPGRGRAIVQKMERQQR